MENSFGPGDSDPKQSEELDAEELDLVTGGFVMQPQPAEDEPFNPGSY